MTRSRRLAAPLPARAQPIGEKGQGRSDLAPVVLSAFALDGAEELIGAIAVIAAQSPFRHMVTPGGFSMSVAMTNCGAFGWVTDRSGYRYSPTDPESGRPWPAMPAPIRDLAMRAADRAGFGAFAPDACLINRYAAGAKLALHQDKDERDYAAPIVSVSLGLPATFLFGGLARRDKVMRIALSHGDVVVWGGAARLAYHGVAPLKEGDHPQLGSHRFNMTIRKAS